MRFARFLFLTLALGSWAMPAHADKIKIGAYSGRVGHYALIGLDFGTRLDLVVMNAEARESLRKLLSKQKLGEAMECEVDGDQQQIDQRTFYTLFKVKSCK